MAAEHEGTRPEPGSEKKRTPRRLILLVAILVLAAAAYVASLPLQQQYLRRAQVMNLEADQAEAVTRGQHDASRRSQERLKLLERLAAEPEGFDLLMETGKSFAQDRRYDDAIFYFQEARRIRPKDVEPYRALSQVYLSLNYLDRAFDTTVAGLQQVPDDLDLTLELVHLDTVIGWNRHARTLLDRLQRGPHGGTPRVLIASALVHRQVADAKHAVEDLEGAARLDPKNPLVFTLLAGIQWENGRTDEAEVNAKKALALDPRSRDSLIQLSEIERARRTEEGYRRAQKYAEQALESDPGNQHAFFAIARTLLDQKRYDEAQAVLERLLERYPENDRATLELGKLYVRKGRAAEGQRLLKRYAQMIEQRNELKGAALKINMLQERAEPHVSSGRTLLETGDAARAVAVLRHALTLEPNNGQAREDLGRALAAVDRAGEYPELVKRPDWHLDEIVDQ